MVNVYGDNDEPDLEPLEEDVLDEEAQKKSGLKEFEVLSDKEDLYHENTKHEPPEEEGRSYFCIIDIIMLTKVCSLVQSFVCSRTRSLLLTFFTR